MVLILKSGGCGNQMNTSMPMVKNAALILQL